MRILISLKHWQLLLFFSLFFIGMVLIFLSIPDVKEALSNAAVLFFLQVFFYIAWLYSAGSMLFEKLEDKSGFNLNLFRIAILIPMIYFIILIFSFGDFIYHMESKAGHDSLIALLLFLHIISLIAFIYSNLFIAKSLRSLELGRKANFGEYIPYLLMLWFLFIGIFIIQPKLNALNKKSIDY